MIQYLLAGLFLSVMYVLGDSVKLSWKWLHFLWIIPAWPVILIFIVAHIRLNTRQL